MSNGNAQIVSVSGREVTDRLGCASVSARARQATAVPSTTLDHWALGWIQRTVALAPMLASAVVVAVVATVIGSYLAMSLHRDSGPLIVTVAAAGFLISLIRFRSAY